MNSKLQYFNADWDDEKHYKGYYVDGVWHPLEKNIKVINPNTGEEIDCVSEIRKLHQYPYSSDEFKRQLELLNSCVEWNDTIDRQIKELFIMLPYGLNDRIKKQLDKISIYANRKEIVYSPIATQFKGLYEQQSIQKGISFLCPELDKKTGGIASGTICTIMGGSGSMKTTTAINIAYQAVKDGKNVCYISLEELPDRLFAKLLSRVSVDIRKELSVNDISKHLLSEQEEQILWEEVLPHLEKQKGSIHIIGETELVSYEFAEIERQLKRVDKYIRDTNNSEHGIDLIIVDHIQLLKYASSSKDEYKVINEYVSFFRRQTLSFLGSDKTVAVILLSQANREGMEYARKHNGMYLMQHVAEASEVERASTYIISVYTDEKSQMMKQLRMGTLKLRGSQLLMDTVEIYANGAYYQVGDITIPEQPDYNMNDFLNGTIQSEPSQYSLEDKMAEAGL